MWKTTVRVLVRAIRCAGLNPLPKAAAVPATVWVWRWCAISRPVAAGACGPGTASLPAPPVPGITGLQGSAVIAQSVSQLVQRQS